MMRTTARPDLRYVLSGPALRRRDHEDRPADPDTPLRKTRLRYSRGVCGLYLRGIARQTAKKPSTYYTYPAIIPLIPGDLFFYTLIGINQKNSEMVRTNGFNCALTLVSMSVGFALSFAIAHYVRKAKIR
jgi:hypothetical protein